MKKLFIKKDYIEYCRHNEPLVREWAIDNLTTHFPKAAETIKCALEMYEADNGLHCKHVIEDFLITNYVDLPANTLYTMLLSLKAKSLRKAAFLAMILAKKQFKSEKLIPEISEMLKMDKHDFTSVHYLVDALGELQNEEGHQILLAWFISSRPDNMLIDSLISNLQKYKKPEDIKILIDKIFEPTPKKGEVAKTAHLIAQFLARQCQAMEFYSCLDSDAKNEQMEIRLDELKLSWFLNPYVKKTVESVYELAPTFNNRNYKTVFIKLIKSIMSHYTERYDFINWITEKDLVQDRQILSRQDEFKPTDLYVCLIIQRLLELKNEVFRLDLEAQQVIIDLVLTLLIVAVEDVDYAATIPVGEKDNEHLWQLFAYDREEIPEEIVKLVIKNGDYFEDRLIELLDKNNSWSLFRAIRVLGEIRSKKAIPLLIEILDEDMWDIGCELIQSALEKIDVPLEILEKGIMSGDFTRAIYLTGVLEKKPYDESAQIIINAYREDVIDDDTELANDLRLIGSKYAIDVLEDLLDSESPVDVYETLLISYCVNGASQEKIDNLKEKFHRQFPDADLV